jgi:hypothetical protein
VFSRLYFLNDFVRFYWKELLVDILNWLSEHDWFILSNYTCWSSSRKLQLRILRHFRRRLDIHLSLIRVNFYYFFKTHCSRHCHFNKRFLFILLFINDTRRRVVRIKYFGLDAFCKSLIPQVNFWIIMLPWVLTLDLVF